MSTYLADFPLSSPVVAHGVAAGIPWVAARAPVFGAVNGYCRLPDGHPWLALGGSDIETTVPWGEITYGKGNWVGFDSLHAGQHWPEMEKRGSGPYEGDTLMSDSMVIAWAELLALDAAEASR